MSLVSALPLVNSTQLYEHIIKKNKVNFYSSHLKVFLIN